MAWLLFRLHRLPRGEESLGRNAVLRFGDLEVAAFAITQMDYVSGSFNNGCIVRKGWIVFYGIGAAQQRSLEDLRGLNGPQPAPIDDV